MRQTVPTPTALSKISHFALGAMIACQPCTFVLLHSTAFVHTAPFHFGTSPLVKHCLVVATTIESEPELVTAMFKLTL